MKQTKTVSQQRTPIAIDWEGLRRRITAAQAALESGGGGNPEEKRRILRERAKALAKRTEEKTLAQEQIEVVEFVLAYERYAIESRYVREVYPLKELTPLPCTPAFVSGIINIRGQIVSVIDLKKFFDLPEKGLTDLNKVIVVESERMQLGILADAILGVRTIRLPDVQTSLPTLTGIRAEYLLGVTKERLVVLDVQKILCDKNIVVQEEVRTEVGDMRRIHS